MAIQLMPVSIMMSKISLKNEQAALSEGVYFLNNDAPDKWLITM